MYSKQKYNFEYGWCYTDHKDGREIRENYYRPDYMFGSRYSEISRELFEKIGLPFPDKEQTYRGTTHDMLFVNSHNVVVKIGPTDISDIISPLILQPLGWVSSDRKYSSHFFETPLTVSVFPGVKLLSKCGKFKIEDMKDDFYSMACCMEMKVDGIDNNLGYVDIKNSKFGKKSVPLTIDIDNRFSNIGYETARDVRNYMDREKLNINNNAELVDKTIKAVYLNTYGGAMGDFVKAFEVHQPLRISFWNAINDDMGKFWGECAGLSKQGKKYEYPVWKFENREYKREIVTSDRIVLYSPWKDKIDNKAASANKLCL